MPIPSVNETEIEAISATPHIKIGLFVMKGNSPQDYPRFGHSVWQFSDGAFLADIFSSFQRHWHKLTWMNVLGAIAIVFSMLGFAGAHRFFKTKSRKTRVIACLTLGILAIPSILFAIYYLHVLPEKVWFYTFRSWSGTELLAGFLGAACGVLATLLPRFLLMIPLGFTMVMASVPYQNDHESARFGRVKGTMGG
jgi:ABC-type phosphate transport system permease subunit